MHWIGLMSGTSADAIDAALVEWPDDGSVHPFRLRAYREFPLDSRLRHRIHALAAPGETSNPLRELGKLDVELGEAFAAAALALLREAGMEVGDIEGIASHGQTVAHHPDVGSSTQIANASVIAERTGKRVVADFRSRDLAAGGEGAPLAPFFHFSTMASAEEGRLVLNLGGIANVTWLPPGCDADDVLAFDVGPANVLIDEAVRLLSGGSEAMDRDGRLALAGEVDSDCLQRLLDDEFLRRPPPKSTGRERYGPAQAEKLIGEWRQAKKREPDLVATLVAFTVEAVRQAAERWLGGESVDRLLVGGGGASNPAIMAGLADAFAPAKCESMQAAGVPPEAAEAMAFSLMGRNALLGIPNHLPATTGARRAAVLGVVVPA
ncbi:MAG: anhydro-N-acetylmuramic acid kinase [Myxococcota bacterium]|nr:anhydro-N-acetylmuramic acid kinase [Myxococcota bacterium]